jgi:Tfp pilus assembly protein PilO
MRAFSLKLKINKERKIILLVGAVVILAGILYRFFPVFESMESLEQEIVLKQKKLQKYRQMVQERNELESRLISYNRIIERAESALLEGETSALAAVDIQNILSEITGKSDLEVLTMRVLKPEGEEEDLYTTIPVQITLRCTVRQLKEVVYQIESAPKLLRIGDLRVRVVRGKIEGQVQATLTVEGYTKKNATIGE